jgi:alanine racemase
MAKVTMSDIAQRLGLSKTAISYAFNEPQRLAPATVEKVMSIAKELGYSPNPIARSMNSQRIGAIGMLIPQDISTALENPYYTDFIRGVGRVCLEENLSLTLVPPLRGSLLNAVNHAAVDGFLVMGLEPDQSEVEILRQRDVPFVLVDAHPGALIPAVNVDDRTGARKAMTHVLRLGHRRIVIAPIESGHNGRIHEYTGILRERILGYLDALTEYALSIDSKAVSLMESDSTLDGGRRILRDLVSSGRLPTAIVAMSDIQALGILDAARTLEIKVPKQLSVVGYDDVPAAGYAMPPLTTVRQPIVEKGERSASLLVQVLLHSAESREVQQITLAPELIVRQSTAPPSSGGKRGATRKSGPPSRAKTPTRR